MTLNDQLLKDLKHNFFKTYATWADSEIAMYNLDPNSRDKVIVNKFRDFNLQPYNSSFKIGNKTVTRMYLPSEEELIYHRISIESKYSSNLLTMNDYDTYITVLRGDLMNITSQQEFEHNHIYLIPAGTLYNLCTLKGAEYVESLRNKSIEIEPQYIDDALKNHKSIQKLSV